jgi:kynurenine formamidase
MNRLIDLSHGLDPTTPVYPGYPPVEIRILESTRYSIPGGRRALNSSQLSVGIHCGTHMDAPFHLFEDGATIDRIDLGHCVGEAHLLHIDTPGNGKIERAQLMGHRERFARCGKIVLSTGWAKQWGRPEYFTQHPVITPDAADFLIECGVHLVGIDFPSVDQAPFLTHVVLLSHNVLILENLTNLSEIRAQSFQLVAIPLKFTGRDGSPVRAVALEIA